MMLNKDDSIIGFSNLNTNDKRNSYNEEILKIYELLKSGFDIGENDSNFTLYNYDSNNEQDFSEDEFLTNEYRNILLIREMVINCLFVKR